MGNTTTAARDVDPKVVSEIWDTLVLLNKPSRPCDIRNMVEDDDGEYKPPHVLRAILRELKQEYRNGHQNNNTRKGCGDCGSCGE